MVQIAGLLNGSNINYDYQVGVASDALFSTRGVCVSGLSVTSGNVGIGYALIKCQRTNGQTVMLTYHNTANVAVTTTGTVKVWVEVSTAKLDSGTLNAVDGTGIASINSGANYPASNYLPLAVITSGTIVDDRPLWVKQNARSADIASGATVDLATATGRTVIITGSVGPITSLGVMPTGCEFVLVFDWAPIITHNTTSLKLPGYANITAAADDTMTVVSEGGGNWRCTSYNKSTGTAIVTVEWVPFPFGDGSDGALTITSGTTNLNLNQVYNYSSISISVGATLSTAGTNGEMRLKCSGITTISGQINLTGKNTTPLALTSSLFGNIPATIVTGTGGAGGNGGRNWWVGGAGSALGYGWGGGGGGGTWYGGGAGGAGGTPIGTGGTSIINATATAWGTSAGGGGGSSAGLGANGGGGAYSTAGANATNNQTGGGGGAGANILAAWTTWGANLKLHTFAIRGSGSIVSNGSVWVAGGAGGNGGKNWWAGGAEWGGGGGGGGSVGGVGWILHIVVGSGILFPGTINNNGGAGGAGGAGGGSPWISGSPGSAGSNWTTWALFNQLLKNIIF